VINYTSHCIMKILIVTTAKISTSRRVRLLMLQWLMESVNSVSQSASRYEEAHIAVFACFELGMMKAQAAQNTTVSVSAGLCSMFR